jgi:hypothetical protein
VKHVANASRADLRGAGVAPGSDGPGQGVNHIRGRLRDAVIFIQRFLPLIRVKTLAR